MKLRKEKGERTPEDILMRWKLIGGGLAAGVIAVAGAWSQSTANDALDVARGAQKKVRSVQRNVGDLRDDVTRLGGGVARIRRDLGSISDDLNEGIKQAVNRGVRRGVRQALQELDE